MLGLPPGLLARQRLLPVLALAALRLFTGLTLLCHTLRLFATQGLLSVLKLAAFCLALMRGALFLLKPDRLLSLGRLLVLACAALLGLGLAVLVFAGVIIPCAVVLGLLCLLPRLRLGCVLALFLDLLLARSALFAVAIALGILGGGRHRAGGQQRDQGRTKQRLDSEDHVTVPTGI